MLVPFPVLGIPSIQAGKVELAVLRLTPPQKFYEFYRKAMASRGVMDGNRAFAIAKAHRPRRRRKWRRSPTTRRSPTS